MRGRHSKVALHMHEQARLVLQQWQRSHNMPVGKVRRARALLLLDQGHTYVATAKLVGLAAYHIRKWARRFLDQGVLGLSEKPRPGRRPVVAPEVALHVVKLACERPDRFGTSLSQWDCTELARPLQSDGLVQAISPETIRRILRSHKLKPWRQHLWLSAKAPRNAQFTQLVRTLVGLYTRPLGQGERVLCVDEKTNLQPRPR